MPEKRRKHGPTPKPLHEQRRHGVSCRLTDAEIATLDRRRGQVSRGEWLRLAALSKPPRVVPEINRTAWADLSRAAGNLNQIAKAIHESRLSSAADVGRAVTEVRAQLVEVRALLIGMKDPSSLSDEGDTQ